MAEVTVEEMLAAIRSQRGVGNDDAFLAELRLATGYGPVNEQSMDGWAMGLYPSEGLHRTAYEIKTSRADLMRELRKPKKRQPALAVSNFFYFVLPDEVPFEDDEIPAECGVLRVADGTVSVQKKAPFRETCGPSWAFVASIVRRAAHAEFALRQERELRADA